MSVVALPLTGGCVCGALRYSLGGAPLMVYACHCHDCQTRSGSAFALTAVVAMGDLAMTGPVDVMLAPTRAGRELEHSFCPTCRVRVLVRATAAPDYGSLLAGTFDDASWAVPIAQTYVESAIPWAVIPGVRNVPAEAFDFYELGEAWRATAPTFAPPPA